MIRWYFILLIILLSCKSQKAERYFDFEEQKTKNVTNATSYKGEYSLQIFSEGRGVIDSVFYDLPDLKITATAKIKGNCEEFYFALRGVGGIFYFTRENKLKRINEEWSEVKVEGFVPPNFNGDKVEILFINDCEKTVYVDDATVLIERERSYPEFPELKKVELNIASAEFDSLKQYRKRAYSHNFIPKSSKVYLPAKLKLSETNYDVDVKLKGDWHDHIYGDKWSFKIKSTKDSTFSFNLQKIEARNYLMEYVYHELLKKTRVLTTDYDFVNLFLNGKSMGVYVKEELAIP